MISQVQQISRVLSDAQIGIGIDDIFEEENPVLFDES